MRCQAARNQVWDLRKGKLRDTIVEHDRPVHSCAFAPLALHGGVLAAQDREGEHFVSCDSELVFYWSLPEASEEPAEPAVQARGRLRLGAKRLRWSREPTRSPWWRWRLRSLLPCRRL